MPTFATPAPINVTVEAAVASVAIDARDRADTVVDVRPGNAGHEADVQLAQLTSIDYSDGHLVIRTPKPRAFAWFGRSASVDISIAVPSGSVVRCTIASGDLRASGRLGDCRLTTSNGEVWVEETGQAELITANGNISAKLIGGQADVTTSCGDVRVEAVHGRATLKTSSGDCVVGTAGGRLRIKTADGNVTIEQAATDVEATTACGDVLVGTATSGSVRLSTASGALSVGIPKGTAAWLDLEAGDGEVRNYLDQSDGPVASDSVVEVRARTYDGDITIHRS